jgi:hypothetical protein
MQTTPKTVRPKRQPSAEVTAQKYMTIFFSPNILVLQALQMGICLLVQVISTKFVAHNKFSECKNRLIEMLEKRLEK